MCYTLVTTWKTLDETYYSNTANYSDKDTAIGETHAKFRPMQNDSNVAKFTLLLIDEEGERIAKYPWVRPAVETEENITESTEA